MYLHTCKLSSVVAICQTTAEIELVDHTESDVVNQSDKTNGLIFEKNKNMSQKTMGLWLLWRLFFW